MQLASDVQIPDGLLAEMALLSEKPRLGFRAGKCTVHQGLEAAKSLNHVRDTTTVVRYTWQVSLKAQQQSVSMSANGLSLMEQRESRGGKPDLDAYTDSKGKTTIGFGHLWHKGDPAHITASQAEDMLRGDLATATSYVNKYLKVQTSQAMADSLIDTAYNSERASRQLINIVNRGASPTYGDYIGTLLGGWNDQAGLKNRRFQEFVESSGRYGLFYPYHDK